MYLNTPSKKPTLKSILRKCYRKAQAVFGQIDFVPSGHFYSPIANAKEIEEGIAHRSYEPSDLVGIDLRLESQRALLKEFAKLYAELPFRESKQPHLRYYFDNPAYCHSDGICLYSMIRHLQPQRIIEVGSGFSSALMHDVRDLFFTSNGGGGNINSLHITHIEPYPALLHSLLKQSDIESTFTRILPNRLQEIDLSIFEELEANDILFIDSTHISKINSDVNRIFFKILPRLKRGVYIHFHDIFYPFSYPNDWLRDKNSWNETYLLRAFLSFNTAFEIVFFNTCLNHLYKDEFAAALPLSQKNTGGSIWLKRL
ncbi:class I SAM-dependent methyltransferase [uncultured Helicobacter sp.]|uniref:class I SAM-dependent methyltransferase n=1 Tax=uncultured Helicobacter sp. TaxID=175537 RepID=UPI0025E6EA35|nr:class I SAM-dependent methyltransferase [uncultured Helicobacter sp.]